MKALVSLLSVVALCLTVSGSLLAQAAEQPQAESFMAVSSIPLTQITQITEADKTIVVAYVQEQLRAYSLDLNQYLSLDANLQRTIMSLPGRQSPLTREQRRLIIPFRKAVPSTVIGSLELNNVVSSNVLDRYSVPLPISIGNASTMIPAGYTRRLIGNQYVLLNQDNRIVDTIEL
jgi:hypothetical protein